MIIELEILDMPGEDFRGIIRASYNYEVPGTQDYVRENYFSLEDIDEGGFTEQFIRQMANDQARRVVSDLVFRFQIREGGDPLLRFLNIRDIAPLRAQFINAPVAPEPIFQAVNPPVQIDELPEPLEFDDEEEDGSF